MGEELTWLEKFSRYTAPSGSPEIFRKWTGIMIIAGALERRAWVYTRGSNLYPNLYVFLVAPPGVGKSMLTSVAQEMFMAHEDLHVAPTNVSKASLIDALFQAERIVDLGADNLERHQYNSLMVIANELGALIPAYESEFINTLTDIYDNKPYSETKRTKNLEITISNPQLNILAATTPSWLTDLLPKGAWDQGFLSRTILIYAGKTKPVSLFEETKLDPKLIKELKHTFEVITRLYGKFAFTPEAASYIDDWQLSGCKPAPSHPKLMHYNTRRTAHLLKLSIIACVSRQQKELLIRLEDIQIALSWMVEAEEYMLDIFKEMDSGGTQEVLKEIWYDLYNIFLRKQKPLVEAQVIQIIQAKAPVQQVPQYFDLLVRAGVLREGVSMEGSKSIKVFKLAEYPHM